MKLYGLFLSTLLLPLSLVASNVDTYLDIEAYNFPIYPFDLANRFPKTPVPLDNLESLKFYRSELQLYRTTILERYKSSVIDKTQILIKAKKEITRRFKNKSLSSEDYEVRSKVINSKMEELSGGGEVMESYIISLEKYELMNELILERIKYMQKSRITF